MDESFFNPNCLAKRVTKTTGTAKHTLKYLKKKKGKREERKTKKSKVIVYLA